LLTRKRVETVKKACRPTKRDEGFPLPIPIDKEALLEIVVRGYGLKGPSDGYSKPVERLRHAMHADIRSFLMDMMNGMIEGQELHDREESDTDNEYLEWERMEREVECILDESFRR
jgi:hypothetical protein